MSHAGCATKGCRGRPDIVTAGEFGQTVESCPACLYVGPMRPTSEPLPVSVRKVRPSRCTPEQLLANAVKGGKASRAKWGGISVGNYPNPHGEDA